MFKISLSIVKIPPILRQDTLTIHINGGIIVSLVVKYEHFMANGNLALQSNTYSKNIDVKDKTLLWSGIIKSITKALTAIDWASHINLWGCMQMFLFTGKVCDNKSNLQLLTLKTSMKENYQEAMKTNGPIVALTPLRNRLFGSCCYNMAVQTHKWQTSLTWKDSDTWRAWRANILWHWFAIEITSHWHLLFLCNFSLPVSVWPLLSVYLLQYLICVVVSYKQARSKLYLYLFYWQEI